MSVAELEKKRSSKAAIEGAATALGTAPPSGDGIDDGPQDVHAGDDVGAPAPRSGQLTFDVGGKRPTQSGLRLVGGKIDVPGVFKKGETIVLSVKCKVGEVAFVDQTDAKTGQVVGCERRHKARIVGVEVV